LTSDTCKNGHVNPARKSNGTCKPCEAGRARARRAKAAGREPVPDIDMNTPGYADDSGLLAYCNPAERRALLDGEMPEGDLRKLKARAALQGWAPKHDYTRTVPEPFKVRGVSTLYNGKGEVAAQWVKSSLDKDMAAEALRATIEELGRQVVPRELTVPRQEDEADDDILVEYPIGDPHVGMLAWGKETGGEDYDLEIAERLHVEAMSKLVNLAPRSAIGIVANLGDFFHTSNYSGLSQSGHRLDVDSRLPKMIEVGVRMLTAMVDLALGRHDQVLLYNVIGNHDMELALALSTIMKAYYRLEPRVQVPTAELPRKHHYYQFGKVLLGFTHGDRTKGRDLPTLMAEHDKGRPWGATEFRYFHHGHVHSDNKAEFPGCIVESFRNLPPNDAWHASERWRSGSDMTAIVHHRNHGEICRHRVGVSQLRQTSER
jgi:hypothetical protein